MKILATIKELSENYKVPIRLMAEPDGTIKIYVNHEQVTILQSMNRQLRISFVSA